MMRCYYYEDIENGGIIRVFAKQKPSFKTAQRTRLPWKLQEFDGKKWVMPCFPEVTWGVLSKLKFIGSPTTHIQQGYEDD